MPTRREFLSAVTATTGTALFVSGAPDTLRVGSGVAAAAVPENYYLEGIVAGVATGMIAVKDRFHPTAAPIKVLLTPQTNICKGACGLAQTAIQLRDRVDVWTFDLPNQSRGCTWVNVNVVGFMGAILRLDGHELIVQRSNTGRHYHVHVSSTTRIQVDELEFVGATKHLNVGDLVHVGGASPTPEVPPTDVLATLITTSHKKL